jgi:hypothetical protein
MIKSTKSSEYSFYSLVDTPYADPICAMALNDHMLALGTMLGRITVYFIGDKRSILLSEISAENISGASFESDYVVNLTIGDKEILKYEFAQNQSGQLVLNSHSREEIFATAEDHYNKCETSFTLICKEKVLVIDLNNKDRDGIKQNISFFKVISGNKKYFNR